MCVNRLSWEASDGKKRARRHSSTPDFEKSEYFLGNLVEHAPSRREQATI